MDKDKNSSIDDAQECRDAAGYQRKIQSLEYLYEKTCRQNMELNSKLAKADLRAQLWEQRYQAVLDSRSWRFSKPIRIPGRIMERLRAKRERKQEALKKRSLETVKFSILMPVYNARLCWLEKAVASVKRQDYGNWELCIVDDASKDRRVKDYLSKINHKKIKVASAEENGGISAATNMAAEMADGDYFLLMDQDDEIAEDALAEFARCIMEKDADVIYSDQDIVDEAGNHSCPFFKPDWSPDLLRSQMYIGHLCGFRRSLFETAGGFRKEFDGSQDYDLLLRITEKAAKIEHVSKILYSWRALPSSTAANPDSKPYAQHAGLRAVQAHLDRVYGEGMAQALETENLFVYDTVFTLDNDVKISIIIPTKDHAQDLKMAVDSIFEKTAHPNFEIIIMNNNSEEQSTYDYFEAVQDIHHNVRVVDAFYDFNWSKLNNHGMREASGDVYIFLNNDVRVLTSGWMERLAGRALCKNTGAAGAMLLYADGSIQHAGVVVGFGGWADHVYKGSLPSHLGTPFISPMVTRNVLAVTGACMAVSKQAVEKIGGFDEGFVVCGSDVEFCIRGYQNGLVNVYDPQVRLFHFESKSRGSYISDTDFKLSRKIYDQFADGDPYYNKNLDYNSLAPAVRENNGDPEISLPAGTLQVNIPEITPVKFRKTDYSKKRWNILLPSLNPGDVFGGIATAYKFFEELVKKTGYDGRIILTDASPDMGAVENFGTEYRYVPPENDSRICRQIVPFADRFGKTLPVSDSDYFIFTAWWTAYCIQEEYRSWRGNGLKVNPFIYFIQDYEPGFYAWSSRYLMADSTYRSSYAQAVVFNSKMLKDYFDLWGYRFRRSYIFDPVLNDGLKKVLEGLGDSVKKKKRILVYGRPNTQRNAFELLVEGLRKWAGMQHDLEEWEVLSAGESHGDVELGNGSFLKSAGKLNIEDYAAMLAETYAGISLMVSPHPSYPPLEMSVFGVKVITNAYANKDLSAFNENILSLEEAGPYSIAAALKDICSSYTGRGKILKEYNKEYCTGCSRFPFIADLVSYVEEGG